MKKLLSVLFLLAGTLLLPAPAQATVSCSVPFNLTNGTVADASQVMANYNAILACLSTSTASSGANTDITSLGGLTTPITPAQGGAVSLCGALGYKAVNDGGFPNSELDLSFLQAVVTNSTNAVQFGATTSLTLNLSTNGVDGLDTGALAPSSVYYIWLIGNGTVIHSLASLSSTAPTMPGGYTFKCRVGAVPTTAGTLLYQIVQLGDTTTITQSLTGTPFDITGINTGTCFGTFTAEVITVLPTTISATLGLVFVAASTAAAVGRSTSGTLAGGQNPAGTNSNYFFRAPTVVAQTVYYCSNDPSDAIIVIGWVDTVNVH